MRIFKEEIILYVLLVMLERQYEIKILWQYLIQIVLYSSYGLKNVKNSLPFICL